MSYFIASELVKIIIAHGMHPRIAVRSEGYCALSDEELDKLEKEGASKAFLSLLTVDDILKGVKHLILFNDLGLPPDQITDADILISKAVRHQVKHIIKCSLLGCEQWNRKTGNINSLTVF